jgi:SPP1 gp7 family putative phage head morphogenesis protein
MSSLTTNAGRASAKRRAVKRAGGGNGSAGLKTTRLDPTRTVMMRKALTAEMRRRFARLKALVVKLVVDEDAFGADRAKKYDTLNITTNAGRWYGMPDREKVRLFAEWLKRQMGAIVAGKTARDILKRYAMEGMKKGAGRAFDDVRKREKFLGMEDKEKLDFYNGSKDQFLRESFRQPVVVQRVEALAGRSYDDLENITTDMSARMGRTLMDGLVQGKGAEDLATDLADQVDIGRTRAEVIARTEIIRAHAEGQLQSMEEMGITEVGVAVEWSTAGDERVCPKCEALEGIVLKVSEAHGMIPRHPNCRCSFLPAGLGEDDSDQIDTKRGINKALEEAGEDDDWGPDIAISRDRPEGIFNADENLPLLNWCNQYGGDTCKDGSGFTPKDKEPKETKSQKLDKALDHIKKLREKKRVTPKDVKELTDYLSKLTVAQVQAIKKGMNVKASGNKKELVEKVAKGVKEQLLKDRPKLEKQPPPKQPEAPKVEKDPIGKLPKDATTDQRLKAFQEHMDVNHPRNLTPQDEKRLEEVKEKLFGGKRLRGREEMQKEYNDLVNKKYNNQMNADSERVKVQAREALVRAFKVDEPADVRFGAGVAPGRDGTPYQPSTPTEKAALDTAHSFVRSLTAQNGQDDPIVVQYYRETGNDRAHQTSEWYINIGSYGDKPSAIIHELGHIIENQKPGVRDAAKDFLVNRIGKDERNPEQIGGLKGEYGFKDKFEDAFGGDARYVGKVYPIMGDGSRLTPGSLKGAVRDTEIISMGMQKLYDHPYHFARTDPEYMKFILGTLRDRTYRGRRDDTITLG